MYTSLLTRTLRTPLARSSSAALRSSAAPLVQARSFRSSSLVQETGGVSQQPGSKSFSELGHNALEETKQIGKVVVGAVTGKGGEGAKQEVKQAAGEEAVKGMGSLKSDVDAIKGLAEEMPKDALMWGGLGLVPYAGTSLATVYLARQASIAVSLGESSGLNADAAMILLQQVQELQVAYGAVLLSFLGAIHWGFEFAKYPRAVGNTRYTLGIVPSVIGCGTLLLAPQAALITQWAAFFGTWYADQQATSKGLTPRWYSTYRFWLTAVVGSSILVTLGAESYYGSDGQAMERKNAVMKLGQKGSTMPTGKSTDQGDMRLTKTDTSATEGYTTFSKIDREAEEKQKEKDIQEKEEEAKKTDAKPTASQEEREEKARKARSQSGVN